MKRGKNSVATIIVGALPKPESSEEMSDKDEASEDSDYTLMAEEVLDAIKEGDASSLGLALKAFFNVCMEDREYGSEDEEEEEVEPGQGLGSTYKE